MILPKHAARVEVPDLHCCQGIGPLVRGGEEMTAPLADPVNEQIQYPDSDGQPISDNTPQFQWIVTIQGNLDAQFHADANVFVAGDLL
jgi:hypothetical protein